jgi:hypothetical protein
LRKLRTTCATISALQSRPVLIAATGKFFSESSICSRTISESAGWMRETFPGVSATMQVMAVSP